MQAQERVLEELKKKTDGGGQVTAGDLAQGLNLSRQVVSHYLNRLLEQGLAGKTETRPVYWRSAAPESGGQCSVGQCSVGQCSIGQCSVGQTGGGINPGRREEDLPEPDLFDALIGAEGSQQAAVMQCKASVNYPPSGLPILIIGESGVGKSHLAGLICGYARKQGVIEKNAPYVVLNCADYANNPELLSAALFGYKKGSFTGAVSDKEGLLSEADGGYLFLDEVHRLSYENQEKLFVFMDTGKYRPLGDSRWKTASVRFIFATTEKPEEVLLETFRRRITVQISLPSMTDRPLSERLELVQLFYRSEAEKVGKNIVVDGSVVARLCFSKMKGNIGKLKNLVQISCANAYFRQQGREKLFISPAEFPPEEWLDAGITGSEQKLFFPGSGNRGSGNCGSGNCEPENRRLGNRELEVRCGGLGREGETIRTGAGRESEWICRLLGEVEGTPREERERRWPEFLLAFKKHSMEAVQRQEREKLPAAALMRTMYRDACRELLSRYGVAGKEALLEQMAAVYSGIESCGGRAKEEQTFTELKKELGRMLPRAWYVGGRLTEELERRGLVKRRETEEESDLHRILGAMFLAETIREDIELNGLIVAHGDSTASSIRSVANQVCGTYIFEAIDMPMDTSVKETIDKVNRYLEHVDTGKGMVILVDMGSLNQMYASIKANVSGDLLIVNNLTTCIALDIGFKMMNKKPFRDISEEAKSSYPIGVQYFEGIARGNNLIVSCMSGVGIADKIRELIERTLDDGSLSVLALDYQELKRLLSENDLDYFKNTKLILTTSNLGADTKVPWINIYDLMGERGEKRLWSYLRGTVSQEKLELLNREFVKFFSLEGIVSRLQFLNPAVVINEVEHVLLRYEQRYHLELDGRTKLNLYMHIAFMIERLMVSDTREDEEQAPLSKEEEIFFQASREIFSDIEKRYHITLNHYELSLLYELFRRVLAGRQPADS